MPRSVRASEDGPRPLACDLVDGRVIAGSPWTGDATTARPQGTETLGEDAPQQGGAMAVELFEQRLDRTIEVVVVVGAARHVAHPNAAMAR